MSCRGVRTRFSAFRDGVLPLTERHVVERHLAACAACADRWRVYEGALEALRTLPTPEPGDLAARVLERVALESRSRWPALATLFRAPRPLILPSLVPAAILVLVGVLTAGWLDHRLGRVLVASGSDSSPLSLSSEVSAPQVQTRDPLTWTDVPEGSFFLETVVTHDGRVSKVTLLNGDVEQARPLLDALRRERFEPGRFHGRPVAVSVYRLFSRMDVRAPRT